MILELLTDAFENGKFRTSFYEAKKVIYKLGLNYTKIDVCPKKCMLYCGKDENLDNCGKKKLPVKVLCYFPLKPRLKRLFMSPKIVNSMRWHVLNNIMPLTLIVRQRLQKLYCYRFKQCSH